MAPPALASAGSEPAEPRPYAVLDIDATLSDVRHRLHLVAKPPKNWDAFFSRSKDDPPLPDGLTVAAELAREHEIVYLTGRPERIRKDTENWLKQHGLPDGRLLMRPENDRRPSVLMKLGRLRRLASERKVDVLVDDDVAVCKAAEKAGFAVLRADWAPDEAQPTIFEAQEQEGRT